MNNSSSFLRDYRVEIILAVTSIIFAVLSYVGMLDKTLGLTLAFVLFLFAIMILRLSVIVRKLDAPKNAVRVTTNSTEALKIVSEKLRNADGSVHVYGRGPAFLDDRNEEYMRSVLRFLEKTSYYYYRILVSFDAAPESTYLWLLFIQKILPRHHERIYCKLSNHSVFHGVLTPFQVIGEEFTHYVHGYFSTKATFPQVLQSVSTFYLERNTSLYFKEFFLANLWSEEEAEDVNRGNIEELLKDYEKACNADYVEDAKQFVERVVL